MAEIKYYCLVCLEAFTHEDVEEDHPILTCPFCSYKHPVTKMIDADFQCTACANVDTIETPIGTNKYRIHICSNCENELPHRMIGSRDADSDAESE